MWRSEQIELMSEQIAPIVEHLKTTYRDPEQMMQLYSDKQADVFEMCSLAAGIPGICIVVSVLDQLYPQENWQPIGHQYALKLQSMLNEADVQSIGLWTGLTGVAQAFRLLSNEQRAYRQVIQTLDEFMIDQLHELIDHATDNLHGNVEMSDYDVIEGLTGIGRYFIQYYDRDHPAVIDIIQYMIQLTESFVHDQQLVPGWYISSANQFLLHEQAKYAQGNFNLGLSHGIAGPLALLSTAWCKAIELPGQYEAIQTIVDFYQANSSSDEIGTIWPERISFEHYSGSEFMVDIRNNESWCYGYPAICNALLLASEALQNNELQHDTLQTLSGLAKRELQQLSIHSPTFCHGYAGLLHMNARIQLRYPLPELMAVNDRLLQQMMKSFDPQQPLGFLNVEYEESSPHPGLLTGSAGILLVLAEYMHGHYSSWDHIFLLH
ncbi:lanthionine synthetase C family protein [Paenibacillus campi]|uniref:lanthionine synthetase C family protein n=1 Tax=Paenibacillus campi TaxID=3106031 RepID=UPI002AFE5A91|nr:lanthionine synthetase C family protein [Paenibacillus sp. SGZ-1014]